MMPPLTGLENVLESSPFPRLSPWAKGCRPPRRASNDNDSMANCGAYDLEFREAHDTIIKRNLAHFGEES
jgi:hypothetical protein